MLEEIDIPELPKKETPLFAIREYPDQMLKERAQPWLQDVTDPRFQEIVDGLEATMLQCRALGLAGPQIGVPYRILAVNRAGKAVTMINPVIKAVGGDPVAGDEGCLSFPGLFIKVKRAPTIEVTYTTRTGETKTERLTGMDARAVQHEVDHLDGVVFVDRIPKVMRSDAFRKWKMAPRVARQQDARIKKFLEKMRTQAPKKGETAPPTEPAGAAAPVT